MSPPTNRRWDSEVLTVRRLPAEQAFGEVLRFESRLERWRPAPKGGWRESSAVGLAGGLYDLGVHLIDQALHLVGPASGVVCRARSSSTRHRSRRRRVPRAHSRIGRALPSDRDDDECVACRTNACARLARGVHQDARRHSGSRSPGCTENSGDRSFNGRIVRLLNSIIEGDVAGAPNCIVARGAVVQSPDEPGRIDFSRFPTTSRAPPPRSTAALRASPTGPSAAIRHISPHHYGRRL